MRIIVFLFTILLGIFAHPCFAAPNNQSPLLTAAQQQVVVERTRNSLLAKKLQSLQNEKQTFKIESLSNNTIRRADLIIAIAQADVDSLNQTLNSAQQTVTLTTNNLSTLENQWQSTTIASQQAALKKEVDEQHALLSLQQDRVKILQKTRDLAQQTLSFAKDWKTQLQTQYRVQEQLRRHQTLDELANRLQQEQKEWLIRITQLNQQLQTKGMHSLIQSPNYAKIEFRIFEAEERSNLIQNQLDLAKLRNGLDDWSLLFGQNLSLSTLNNAQHQIASLNNQLSNTEDLLNKKIDLIQEHLQLTNDGIKNGTITLSDGQDILATLNQLLYSYKKQLSTTQDLEKQGNKFENIITKQLQKQLSNRQNLPGFDLQAWLSLGKKIGQLPALALENMRNLYKPLTNAILNAQPWQWFVWPMAVLVWLGLWIKLRRFLAVDIARLEQRSRGLFSAQTIIVVLQLLNRHLVGVMLTTGLIGLLFLLGIPLKVFGLVLSLMVVILAFRIVLELAKILLLENISDENVHNVALYYRLKWALIIGGIITALTLAVHQLPVNYELQDLFGRLFMLFLLVVSLVLMKSWEAVPKLIEPYLNGKHHYLRRVIRWISFLVPLSLLFNALLGLIGYVELAWAIAAYQGLFLIVLTGYLILRGLLDELIRWLSDQCIRNLRNGWLWSEAFLKPFHQILKLVLFFGTILFLFMLYGWGEHSVVVNKIGELLSLKIISIAGSVITPLTIIELVIVIVILIWASRWSREFSYRWLFARTKDLSLRNSFAIFTQYFIIAIGIIIALNIAGLSLTALTFIVSAFGLGIGLGLRDLANNFVSGILLLIERPVKVGDWVTVGTTEGQVTHIGARSITVTTDDHQELLVPNADVFSKAFINWTHRDSVVRVLVPVRVNRVDDPRRVRQIILETLKTTPNILANPKTEVYFKEIDQILLEFKVEYYVDMNHIDSRSEVRSHFLFALWERFKTEGIHPPDVAHEVIIQERK